MEIDRPISIAFTLFAIMVVVLFLLAPKYNEFKSSQAVLGKVQAEYNGKFEYYANVDKAYRDIQAHKEGIDKIDDALPDNPSIAGLIYFFQQKSQESGLIVKDLFLTKFSPASADSDVKDIAFSLNLLGTYDSLKSFLSSLEGSARLFETSGITFGSVTVQSVSAAASTKTSSKTAQTQTEQAFSFKLQIKTHSY